MNIFSIGYKDLKANPLNALLNLLLVSFGIAILTVLLLGSTQIGDKLEQNAKDIDLIVGAKGSPLQLILSSIFYIDFPMILVEVNDPTDFTFKIIKVKGTLKLDHKNVAVDIPVSLTNASLGL